ncbi:FAT domain-containing protein [Ditylenchus destructor]|uniref:Serine/threonine-protein kinase TOR n=1 Tax=Ditylenchus destructor TaxID=166010 RepID=A0AAD4R2D4_9BILA|nr:FAT domain-containing protein [Ditylenchus destructor]
MLSLANFQSSSSTTKIPTKKLDGSRRIPDVDKERIRKQLQVLRHNPDVFNRCMNILENGESAVFEAIRHSEMNEKKAGIFLIVCLVESNSTEEATAHGVTRFARELLNVLTHADESVMRLTSRAIAYLILTSKIHAVELMETALNLCMEWLEEVQRNEDRLLAAVILARDLALFTPPHFFQRATHFFNHIFKVIRDSKVTLRIAATQALQAALAVTSQREAKHKNEWYKKCFEEASEKSNKEEAIHTSLLIFNELLRIANIDAEKLRIKTLDIPASRQARLVIGQNPVEWLNAPAHPVVVESRTAKALVSEHYFAEITNRCMELRTHKSVQCQLVLLEIFPRLSSFADIHDVIPYQDMLNHALQLTHKHSQALMTVGLLCVDRPAEVRHKAQTILNVLIEIIQQTKRKPMDTAVFKCLMLLIRSQKNSLCESVKGMLPLLFSTGLSKGLTEVLKEVVESIPQLKTDVLDGLMEQLYQILMHRARPSKLAAPTPPPIPSGPIQPSNVELTKLALKTLGEFDFQRHALQMFMRYIAQGYLVSDSMEVRLAAVYCCAEIVKPFIKVHESVENDQKAEVYSLIENVLKCLLQTAVVDSEVDVRMSVLKCLAHVESDFLYHLAQVEMLKILFMTLHDENYQIQEEGVALLGQLAELNPAMVFPKLRNIVLVVISLLMNSRTPKIEEHSAKIIVKLAAQCPKFMSPYLDPLLIALIPLVRLDRRNVDVTVYVLNALSELSLIGGPEIVFALCNLFPSLVSCLQDSTSLRRREASLRAIGSFCSATGYVVDPYKDYPGLLDTLLKFLKTELSVSMRRQTMKVLGIIGALDPYTHKVYLGTVHSHKSKSLALSLPNANDDPKSDVSDIIQWVNYERCTLVEYYPALAIAHLVEMLQDEALVAHHKEIVSALLIIFSNLGAKSSQYIGQVVPRLIDITENCRPELRQFFLSQFSAFASIIRVQLKPFMRQILALIAKAWNWDGNIVYRGTIIEVLEEMGKAFGTDFSIYVTDLCPYLLEIVQSELSDPSSSRELTLKALSCVRSIVQCVGAHIHLILTPILSVLNKSPDHVRQSALDTIISITCNHSVYESAPEIMQTWLRCISVKLMQERLMQLLNILVLQMWDKFLVYKDRVNNCLNTYKVDPTLRQEYLEQLALIHNNKSLLESFSVSGYQSRPDEQTLASIYAKRLPMSGLAGGDLNAKQPKPRPLPISIGREKKHLINVDQLRKVWNCPQSLTSREDWLQWLSTLRTQFIRQSPSAPIRACASLAEVYEHLAKELFNSAFMSIWTDIRESEQDELTNQLVDVLTLCPHSEPIQAILNLAEFMDHSEKGPLPVNYKMLSKCAEQTRAYAKALRYKELEIITMRNGEPNAEDCQSLITYASKLNLEEGAAGVVQYAEKRGMEISGRWYEKLGEWEKALEMYESTIFIIVHDDLLVHQMRCLDALGRWSELGSIGEKALSNDEGADRRQKIAQMMAKSCWALGDYDKMREYVEQVSQNSQDGSFLRAVVAIEHNHFKEAVGYSNKVRDMFDSELTAMAAESYERAYGAMILVQQLAELDEAIEYKMRPEREARIAVLWSRRLQGCRRNISHWQKILLVRSIVLSQNELRPLWIKFSSLCRKQNKLSMARNVLQSLLNVPTNTPLECIQIPLDKPQLALAVCKQLWIEGHRRSAFAHLETLTSSLYRIFAERKMPVSMSREQFEPTARITAKCYLKLGEWHSILQPSSTIPSTPPLGLNVRHASGSIPVSSPTGMAVAPAAMAVGTSQYFRPYSTPRSPHAYMTVNYASMEQSIQAVLRYYQNATTFDPNWYKAWHRLATTFYNLVMADKHLEHSRPPSAVPVHATSEMAGDYAGAAAMGVTLPPLGVPPAAAQMTTVDTGAAEFGHGIHPQQQLHTGETQRPLPALDVDEAIRHGIAATATVVGHITPSNSPSQTVRTQQQLTTYYVVNAVKCFFKAIQLAEGSRLDDTLRLLMLWFDYGERPEVLKQLNESLKEVPLESWLEVMPQLIARLDSQYNTGLLVKQLVIDISKVHPQAVIYSLTAAVKSRNAQRSKVAKEILELVAESRPVFVQQAQLLNDELIRCAILWHELWHEALEDASRYYFQEKNTDEMMNVLRPLHEKIEKGSTTLKEQSFNQTYYKELKDAYEHCETYHRTGNIKEMQAAWDLYFQVFKRMTSQLRQMSSLDLSYISPRLCNAKNMELSVPGTYDPQGPLITIASVHNHLQVIMSKQRPRKVYMRGSDGREYAFLLKGHEDPRQDERVMQLFGLVNSLILREADTCRRNLTIQRYSIITLSQSSGLIGWLPNCDTLHALIKDYREKRKIVLSEEHTKMQKLVVDIDKVTLMQKVEVFEETLRTTSGDDLRQALWMKSPNSEVWFDRRTNYTRSMACMSMVGYILGLGDRHPSNLMLDRLSGKIVHIDFGDCFEVAMKREKYPEKIPFRLTRMLIRAMEVTGIEGNYRLTSERVLRLLRQNYDSILSVLEAFVYDPVLNWRLVEGGAKRHAEGGGVADRTDIGTGQKRGDYEAINRVKAKLTGRDFNQYTEMSVPEQVSRLIEQATLNDNLCQCYIGWCPFW